MAHQNNYGQQYNYNRGSYDYSNPGNDRPVPATPRQGGSINRGQYQNPQNQQSPTYAQRPISQGRPAQDNHLVDWFRAVDTDGSGELTVEELQRALVNGDWSPFNIETVRMMVNMFDTDNTGTISFEEFKGLWKYIEDWKRCFQTFDMDGSGSIDRAEMRNALQTFGYNLTDTFVGTLIQKFDRHGLGTVTFDNFVQACVSVKTLTDSFRRFDTDNDGWIYISYEQFLELVISQRS
ncbi:hypothetical protein CLU79DRAFT_727211 [Phycomyces nitens]|nr:hypothetical protein CLU79DRAFT_727211 [Phycomyces nitens]